MYDIYPFTCTCSKPVKVWCDMKTDGGGWTVFLNRRKQDNQLDFNRTWEEYKAGFGSPVNEEEYWLGLEVLHIMTYGRTYSLRLDLEASGREEYATRTTMTVDSEEDWYKVRTVTSKKDSWSSNTRYCLQYMNYNRLFSTFDRNYFSHKANCAAQQGGGWWYYNCKYFNPTSPYGTAINLTCHPRLR